MECAILAELLLSMHSLLWLLQFRVPTGPIWWDLQYQWEWKINDPSTAWWEFLKWMQTSLSAFAAFKANTVTVCGNPMFDDQHFVLQ